MSLAKGVDVLVAAIGILAKTPEFSNMNFIFAGSGDHEDLLVALSKTYSNTNFLGFRSDVAAIYRSADLVVVPSRYETFCYVVAEAQATTIPVLASDVNGPKELIVEGRSGFLVAPGDSRLLSNAILSAYNMWRVDFEKYRQIGLTGRRDIEINNSISTVNESILEFLYASKQK
jgi:glycosyltransferase involved in cell wall biosynthesis